ncbi:MAG: pentapeptide repeat-containing protein [Oscillospiraceae bacterium]|nr:pentapeptide repeat-containing protein [Oscillospiraceae bacterium]
MINDNLKIYLDNLFTPYGIFQGIEEIKSELLSDLNEHYYELKSRGLDDETAFQETIKTIGDIQQMVDEILENNQDTYRSLPYNFSGTDMKNTDFRRVKAHNAKFNASNMKNCDFTGADLTGSNFHASDLSNAIFDNTNLTGVKMSAVSLNKSSFVNTILTNTNMSTSEFKEAKFIGSKFINSIMHMTQLKKTIFDSCAFTNVDFKYSDLRGICFDGQIFNSVKFDKVILADATFKGAILKGCSFECGFSLSKKYYRDKQKINFDGAFMDKLTYLYLKSYGSDLSKVTII